MDCNHKIKKKKVGNEKERKENIYFTLVGECIFLLSCPPTNKEVETFTDDIPPLSLLLLRLGYIFDTYYVRVSNLFTVVPSQQLNN